MENNFNNNYMDELKKISSKLKTLHNTILSLYAVLESENVEQQALDAVECIGFCVSDIKNGIDKTLEENV